MVDELPGELMVGEVSDVGGLFEGAEGIMLLSSYSATFTEARGGDGLTRAVERK